MKRFFKWFLIVFIGAFLVLCYETFPYPPYAFLLAPKGSCLSVPFDVSKAGTTIECDIHIKEDASYDLDLAYIYNKENQKAIDNGYKTVRSGAPVQIHVQLFQNVEGNSIKLLDKKTEKPSFSGTSWTEELAVQSAKLVEYIKLKPGHYHIVATSLKDAQGMATIRTEFRIKYSRRYK